MITESFKKLTIITMVSYTLCTIGDIAQMIIRYKYYLELDVWNASEADLIASKDVAYYLGNFTFFLLLFMRIKTSFQLSKCNMYYLSFLLATSTIFSILFCVITIYFAGKLESKYTSTRLHYTVLDSYPLAICDFLLSLSLFILFIYKIKNKDSMEGIEMDADDLGSASSSIIDDKKAIWNVMIKHCVLFGTALVINQSWYIVNIIDDSNVVNVYVTLIMIYSVRSVENAVNIIILWLVLKINSDKYVSLCKCWHVCLLRYCMKEDPNMIREGFGEKSLDERLCLNASGDKIEGHDLYVTDDIDKEQSREDMILSVAQAPAYASFGKSEGHNLMVTHDEIEED